MKTPLFLKKATYCIRANATTILTVSGGIGVIVGFVWGCKASTKLKGTLAVASEEIHEAHIREDANTKDLAVAYGKAGFELAKLYAAPVAVEILSIGAMVGSNYILKRRNVGLAAALMTTTEAFNQYRARVRGRYGDDVDRELRYGTQKGSFTGAVDEAGDPATGESAECDILDRSTADACTFLFKKGNPNWEDDWAYVEFFLAMQQNAANDMLKANGSIGQPLFLSDVLKELSIPPTQASHFLGWTWCPDDKEHTGDNYVDFRAHKVKIKNEHGTYEDAVLLDFNCDGSVLEVLPG